MRSNIAPDGSVRDAVVTVLQDHPEGLQMKDVLKLLGKGDTYVNVGYYAKKGYIGYKDGLYYPNSTDLADKVLAYVTDNPGKSAQELETAIGQPVAHEVGVLKSAHKIHAYKLDKNRYYPGPYVAKGVLKEPEVEVEPEVLPAWFGPTLPEVSETEEPTTEEPVKGQPFNSDFTCPECGRGFAGKSALMAHIRMKHTEEGKRMNTLGVQAAIKANQEKARRGKMPELEVVAKDYYWQTGDDSLRNFVAWYEKRLQGEQQ